MITLKAGRTSIASVTEHNDGASHDRPPASIKRQNRLFEFLHTLGCPEALSDVLRIKRVKMLFQLFSSSAFGGLWYKRLTSIACLYQKNL